MFVFAGIAALVHINRRDRERRERRSYSLPRRHWESAEAYRSRRYYESLGPWGRGGY